MTYQESRDTFIAALASNTDSKMQAPLIAALAKRANSKLRGFSAWTVGDYARKFMRLATAHDRLCVALCNGGAGFDQDATYAKLDAVEGRHNELAEKLGFTGWHQRDPRGATLGLSFNGPVSETGEPDLRVPVR